MGTESPALAELLFTELIEIFAEDSTVDLEMIREDMNNVGGGWQQWADANRYERELDEKYGIWKDFFLHPAVQRAMGIWQSFWMDFNILGEPLLSPTASVVLLFMMYRNKQPLNVIALAASIFFSVHPLVIITVVGLFLFVTSRKHGPRGYRPHIPLEVEDNKEGEDASNLQDQFEDSKLPEEIDHIIIGSNISGLYAAGLLSRLGHTCLVLEEEETMCAGHLLTVASNNGETLWEFEGTSPTMGNPQRNMGLLTAAMGVKNCPAFFPVGQIEDGFAYDMVTIGADGLPIVHRAGKEAMVEELVQCFPNDRKIIEAYYDQMAAIAAHAGSFFLARALPFKMAEHAKSMIGGNFIAYAANSIQSLLGQMSAGSQLFAVLASTFRIEKLDLQKASFVAFLQSFSSRLGGRWYPKGGLRALVLGFSRCIQGTGGRILTKAKVESIIVEGDKATGVLLKNGAKVKAQQSVISCESALKTYKELIPEDIRKRMTDGLPDGIDKIEEAQPKINVFVGIRGSSLELGLPTCDYWQLHNPDLEVESQEWFCISFPSAKDLGWEERYPGKTACVITMEAGDACRSVEQPDGQKVYEIVRDKQMLKRALENIKASALKKLHQVYPEVEGRDEFIQVSKPFKTGYSHVVSRYTCTGLRTATPVDALYLGSQDLTDESFEGSIQAGWLAAHSVVDYTFFDLFVQHRTIDKDLMNV